MTTAYTVRLTRQSQRARKALGEAELALTGIANPRVQAKAHAELCRRLSLLADEAELIAGRLRKLREGPVTSD